jgi:hypothetical protein
MIQETISNYNNVVIELKQLHRRIIKEGKLTITDPYYLDELMHLNKLRVDLDEQIGNHYKPLLNEAVNAGDTIEFERLLKEIPDCGFKLTDYNIGVIKLIK